jgi:hypothetical protein
MRLILEKTHNEKVEKIKRKEENRVKRSRQLSRKMLPYLFCAKITKHH